MLFAIPRYLYHRTSIDSYMKIVMDRKIRHTGTPASNHKFEKLKFGPDGTDKWHCVFLAIDPDLTRGLTWGGDMVLKIRTENLDPHKFNYDGNVCSGEYGKSFTYEGDIPLSEIVETSIDKWHQI